MSAKNPNANVITVNERNTPQADAPQDSTPDAVSVQDTESAIAALAEAMSGTDARVALAALQRAHFNNNNVKLLRTLLRSLPQSDVLRACFHRSKSAERWTYEICGLTSSVSVRSDGQWTPDAFSAPEFSANGVGRTYTYNPRGETTKQSAQAAQRPMLIGWTSYLASMLDEREMTRGADATARTLKDAQSQADALRRENDALRAQLASGQSDIARQLAEIMRAIPSLATNGADADNAQADDSADAARA